MILNRHTILPGTLNVNVIHILQSDIGIRVKEEAGHFILIDAEDCPEMARLSRLFRHVHETNDVIYLQRDNQTHTNLFIFNGAVHPLNFKRAKEITSALLHSKIERLELSVDTATDETFWSIRTRWKYEKQLRIQANPHHALLNVSKLGSELLTHSCAQLADSYLGHSHFDWYSTPNSPELIIRNMARND
ncbi:hypothetical protein [Paenibacillus methanolicus]|uniref:Uncharacterized protein n=1 Tax=Paenibacillus methanolicus TaxID=582686 RepID=A0A5S5C7Y5_9BACL|nr:hypothetical protein [Paenibacillus methanolicus]TYP74718.1 hypothetical protein BCM02_105262 [Paenibacillus methanolicus]